MSTGSEFPNLAVTGGTPQNPSILTQIIHETVHQMSSKEHFSADLLGQIHEALSLGTNRQIETILELLTDSGHQS